jgi:hypothetical protein
MATNYATIGKTCTRCGEEKPRSEFYKNDRYKDGLFSYCKLCQRAAQRKWYDENTDRHRELVQAKQAETLDRNVRVTLAHLIENACVDCGQDDPMVLQFDHRDPAEKEFTVTNSLNGRNEESLRAEIAKCDVRCANCHNKRHQIERGSLKYQLLVKEFGYGK